MDRLQGNRISAVLHAIKNASISSDALLNWNVPGTPFYNGTVHVGTTWLKDNSCGGPHTTEYLFCEFENEPRIGDDMQYKATIANDGASISVRFVISNTAETRGFDFNGDNGEVRSCTIARIAGGGEGNLNSGTAISQVDCDTDTGIITFDIQWALTASEYIARNGSNSPTAHINWDGFNLDGVGQLQVSSIVDADDGAYSIDMNTTSTLKDLSTEDITSDTGTIDILNGDTANFTTRIDSAEANITNAVNAGSVDATGNVTVGGALVQSDSSLYNNFAGAMAIGTGANIATIDSGSVYVPGAIVDANDPSMFFDPNGISRTQDIRLTSRGGVALSNLLPNYVHKGAILIRGPGLVMPLT